jgi:site-specific DNA-methyltransferase (adenine-specific)
MGEEKAVLMVTDPPYGVGFVEKAKDMHVHGYGHSRARLHGSIAGDEISDEVLDSFLNTVFDRWFDGYCVPGCVFYVCVPGIRESAFRNALSRKAPIRQSLVWVKDHMVIGRQDYHWKHETILYGWLGGASHYFVEDHSQTTVWEIPHDYMEERSHPTMKPVALFERMILNSSRSSDVCVDPFVGSGSSLLACERTGRHGRCVEIAPRYVAVCLERFLDFTGETPVRLEGEFPMRGGGSVDVLVAE